MTVAIVIPAAGLSRRFGPDDKLLTPLGDGTDPIVRLTARAACASRAGLVVVVIRPGAPGDHVARALQSLRASLVVATDDVSGMGSSIAAGVRRVGAGFAGVMVLPADMPWVTAAWLDTLIGVFEASDQRSIVVSVDAKGEQRTPVIWPADLLATLAELSGETGGKGLLDRHRDRIVRVQPPSDHVLRDVDTPGDLTIDVAEPGETRR
ncbi:MAG: nucleotidyltransferase family protein [Hyphomicrobiaceae bacterium]|nr:nucleotidyltransferase family protein [Hyphomicrobiaceae bacterium]